MKLRKGSIHIKKKNHWSLIQTTPTQQLVKLEVQKDQNQQDMVTGRGKEGYQIFNKFTLSQTGLLMKKHIIQALRLQTSIEQIWNIQRIFQHVVP